MTSFKFQVGLLLLLCSFALLDRGEGHSYLLRPKGDFKSNRHPHCRMGGPPHAPNDHCPGPCINETSWSYDTGTYSNVYSRGQRVTMVWPRNNHRGGFVRFSLVPSQLRMDKDAHNRLAFRYSCFESGKHVCEFEHCGTDVWLYKTEVQIPTSYPDGDYVLSWAWFGGLTMTTSYFGDYYSCVFVRIHGGELTSSYNPIFHPGESTVYENTCRSSVDRLGVCHTEPCLGRREQKMKPFPFLQNGGPGPITLLGLAKNLPGGNARSPTGNQESTETTDAINESLTQSPLPAPSHKIVPSPSPVTSFKDASVKIIGLKMINTDNSEVMAEEFSKPIRVRADMTNVTFVAITEGDIKSVKFYLDNTFVRTEKVEPYACWGDTKSKFKPWPKPIFGKSFKIHVDALAKNGKADFKVFQIELIRAMVIPSPF